MGYVQAGEHSNRVFVRGYTKAGDYRNRYVVRGLGAYLGADAPVKKEMFEGALVYFDSPDGKVDGSFFVREYDPTTGKVTLLPHWDDYDAVMAQLQKVFGFLGFFSGIEKTSLGLEFVLKDPEKYFKYWDAELNGKTQVQMSMSDTEDVKFIQELLDENNYDYGGTIDGKWKEGDAKGLKVFQKEMGVQETGVLDQPTAAFISSGITVVTTKTQPSTTRTAPATLKKQKAVAPPPGTRKTNYKKIAMYTLGPAAVLGVAYLGYNYYQEKKLLRP